MTSTLHVAIIMDGNGRWAQQRGLPRIAGHRAGADAVRRTIEAAPGLGITDLTLYAFSSDNWKRPSDEVSALMGLLQWYLESEIENCIANDVRLSVIGRRDRLPSHLPKLIADAESRTLGCRGLHLRIALDYSSRDAILAAAQRCAATGDWSRAAMSEGMPAPDVDLLIRTSGEQRLSDYLLWECAYAELIFTPRMWPEFGKADLEAALDAFSHRERRFGQLPAA